MALLCEMALLPMISGNTTVGASKRCCLKKNNPLRPLWNSHMHFPFVKCNAAVQCLSAPNNLCA